MAKVNKFTTLRKALLRGAQYAAVAAAAIQTVPVPDTVGIDQKATVVFVIGIVGAIAKGIHNYRKVSKAPVRFSGYLLAFAALSLSLSGCITTTAPDGTVTQQVDTVALSTMWDRYERLQARQDALEAAPPTPDIAVDLARVQAELEALAARLGI